MYNNLHTLNKAADICRIKWYILLIGKKPRRSSFKWKFKQRCVFAGWLPMIFWQSMKLFTLNSSSVADGLNYYSCNCKSSRNTHVYNINNLKKFNTVTWIIHSFTSVSLSITINAGLSFNNSLALIQFNSTDYPHRLPTHKSCVQLAIGWQAPHQTFSQWLLICHVIFQRERRCG